MGGGLASGYSWNGSLGSQASRVYFSISWQVIIIMIIAEVSIGSETRMTASIFYYLTVVLWLDNPENSHVEFCPNRKKEGGWMGEGTS